MSEKIYKLMGRRRFGRLKKDIPTEIMVSGQTVSVKVKLKTKRNILTGEEADIKTENYRFQKTDVSGMEFTKIFRWFVLDFVQLAIAGILAVVGFQYFWWLLPVAAAYVFLLVRCRHLVITLKSGQKIKIPVMDESSAEELLEELENGMHTDVSENVTVGNAPGNMAYGGTSENVTYASGPENAAYGETSKNVSYGEVSKENAIKHTYCSNCGKELPEGLSFCNGCGAPLGEQKQTGRKKIGLIIATAACVVLLLGGLAFFLFNTFSKDSGTSGGTAKNNHKTHTSMEDAIKEQAGNGNRDIETALSFYEEGYEQAKSGSSSAVGVSLIYLNDDEIPECVIMDNDEGVIWSYVDNDFIMETFESQLPDYDMTFCYIPKSGTYCVLSDGSDDISSYTEYQISRLTNEFEYVGDASKQWYQSVGYEGEGEDYRYYYIDNYKYSINGEYVSSEEYEAYIASLGIMTYISYEDQYNSVQEAYNALVN